MVRKISFYSAMLGIVLLAACANPKNVIYFQDKPGAKAPVEYGSMIEKPITYIKEGDIVDIAVSSVSSVLNNPSQDPVSVFNDGGFNYTFNPTVSVAGGGGGANVNNKGYLVENDGYINFPVIGKVKIAGLSVNECQDKIKSYLSTHIKDPVVNVRILNFKVTVIGEAQRKGIVTAPNHSMNILEALAATGDVPISGRKDNVMVVREINGQKEFARIDLSSRDIFNHPYFYLKQNDIIYIEPNRIRRNEGNEFLRFYLPVISSLISTGLAVYGISQIGK
jgi:polysaccharide export outer membrane protein